MPLISRFFSTENIEIFVWKITESHQFLLETNPLKEVSKVRLQNMKSVEHQKGFLSVRCLLNEAGYSDFDLYYSEDGKPHLLDGKCITISHSHHFSAIAISDIPAGIDLELRRDLIKKLGPKFCISEYDFLEINASDYIRQLTVIWGAKEAVFKIENKVGISFKDHIFVQPFNLQNQNGKVRLDFENETKIFDMNFYEIEDYTLVVVF
jgi:4'-phosphopantetheinyl transferase